MHLTQMVESIIEDTNLLSKRNEITRRVREAITSIHNSAFYSNDIAEAFVDLAGNTQSTFSIPLPLRFKKFARISPVTALGVPIATTRRGNCYVPKRRQGATDYWGVPLVDIYVPAGNKVNVTSSIVPPALELVWYQTPDVSDTRLETWLMTLHSQVFIDYAKARFFKSNGRADIAADIERTLFSVDIQSIIDTYDTAQEI